MVLLCRVMAPKKAAKEGKKKREKILLEMKQEIIRKHEQGMCLTDHAREYKKSTLTISTILKDKDKIIGRAPAKGQRDTFQIRCSTVTRLDCSGRRQEESRVARPQADEGLPDASVLRQRQWGTEDQSSVGLPLRELTGVQEAHGVQEQDGHVLALQQQG
ncbi:hypothetical protein JRQ81_002447, partial [Phrynocephalus forsythii]